MPSRELAVRHAKDGCVVLDAGCGEGFYTAFLRAALENAGLSVSVYGIDVSRDALIACAARDSGIGLAAASISDIPAENGSVDILLNLFAPYDAAEFARVLKPGGALIRVFPGKRHLWELKAAVYTTPYENVIDTLELDGFSLLSRADLRFPLTRMGKEQIETLFKMTPYYYKTSREGQARLGRAANAFTQMRNLSSPNTEKSPIRRFPLCSLDIRVLCDTMDLNLILRGEFRETDLTKNTERILGGFFKICFYIRHTRSSRFSL